MVERLKNYMFEVTDYKSVLNKNPDIPSKKKNNMMLNYLNQARKSLQIVYYTRAELH